MQQPVPYGILRAFLNRLLGDRAERLAAKSLKQSGMRIITRGYNTPHGEIDLVAREGEVVVFVEVKARKKGDPAEAVTLEKQRRLTLAALHFLSHHGLLETPSRFDVVAIVWPDPTKEPTVEHIKAAFDSVGKGQMYR